MSWIEEGACRGHSIDLWFPPAIADDDGTAGYTAADYDEHYAKGRSICNNCPVRLQCLDKAIENKERWGLWGGLIPIERLRIERKARRKRLRERRAREATALGGQSAFEDARTVEECP